MKISQWNKDVFSPPPSRRNRSKGISGREGAHQRIEWQRKEMKNNRRKESEIERKGNEKNKKFISFLYYQSVA